MIRTFQIFEAEEKKDGGPVPYSRDHPINENRILRAEEQLRELRAGHGKYVEENYNEKDDRVAAEKNGIDYQALVLSTRMPAPAAVMSGSWNKIVSSIVTLATRQTQTELRPRAAYESRGDYPGLQ